MWGGGREKVKRDIVNLSKESGGLGMIEFNSFVISLKVKLLQKILNTNFTHPWKSITINQFAYPLNPIISIEAAGSSNATYRFTTDLLQSYADWRSEAASALDCSINHCVWANKAITDIGSKLWNVHLVGQGVYYLSQFLE